MTAIGRRPGQALVLGFAASLLVLVLPMPAQAATVAVENGRVVYRAATGEANDVFLFLRSTGTHRLEVDEESPGVNVTPGAGCVPDTPPPNSFLCAISGSPPTAVIGLADRNDRVCAGATVHGQLFAQVFGGPGNDALGDCDFPLVGGARLHLLGGDGNDRLVSDDDQVSNEGNPVPGDTFEGLAGTDTLDWGERVLSGTTARISLDGVRNDGEPGEGDQVRPDVENVIGANTAIGTEGGNVITGTSGGNRLEGGTGDDVISGLGGPDTLIGRAADDRLTGGQGTDSLHGDDLFLQFVGSDTIEARDGEADFVECGLGADVANVDAIDVGTSGEAFETHCEQVTVARLKIKGKTLRAKNGKVGVKIACPAFGDCEGKLSIKTAKKVPLGGRSRKVKVAKGRFRIPAGEIKKAKAKLTRNGRALLAGTGRVKVRVALRTAGGDRLTAKAVLRG